MIEKKINAAVEKLLKKTRKQTAPETPVIQKNDKRSSSSVRCAFESKREAYITSDIFANSAG